MIIEISSLGKGNIVKVRVAGRDISKRDSRLRMDKDEELRDMIEGRTDLRYSDSIYKDLNRYVALAIEHLSTQVKCSQWT